MITLQFDGGPEDLAAALYQAAIVEGSVRSHPPRWDQLDSAARNIWGEVAERLIARWRAKDRGAETMGGSPPPATSGETTMDDDMTAAERDVRELLYRVSAMQADLQDIQTTLKALIGMVQAIRAVGVVRLVETEDGGRRVVADE